MKEIREGLKTEIGKSWKVLNRKTDTVKEMLDRLDRGEKLEAPFEVELINKILKDLEEAEKEPMNQKME